MNPSYLSGLGRSISNHLGVEIINLGSDIWFVAPYMIVKDRGFTPVKQELLSLLGGFTGRKIANTAEFDWHHVVESQHIRTILFKGDLHNETNFQVPTILIHKPDHAFFSRNFNNNEFRELASISNVASSNTASSLFATPEGRKKLQQRINNLKMMYANAYVENPALFKISNNIFNSYTALLKNTSPAS
jgi:hypothetical protein